ncbi:MAG: serine/threonine-protein kinase [Myxococcota bacterium]
MALQEGDIIHSRYELLRLIGTGTSGSVWAARNKLIDRDVALKVMEPEVMSDKVLLRRFFNEAKAIGRVNHASIVGIFDLGQAEDGSPFLVLELLDGEPLNTRIQREGAMEPETLLDVSAGVAKALDLAHKQGIVHRDLKPANIYLHRTSTGGLVGKILDFGISKVVSSGTHNFSLTKTGTVVGSPAYMSPEQAAGRDDIDGRADVWSLGVVLYEALTGQLPHEAPNYNALMVRILTQDAASIRSRMPDLHPRVVEIVDTCLQRDRDQRVNAGQLSAMLEAATRELRAARFRRSGGRRRDDAALTGSPLDEDGGASRSAAGPTTAKVVVLAATTLLVGCLAGLLAGYYLFQG